MLHYTFERLRDEHARLDQELAVARRAARPDPQRITTLKKRKLAYKDRMAALQAERPTRH